MNQWNIPLLSEMSNQTVAKYKYVVIAIILGFFLLLIPEKSQHQEVFPVSSTSEYNLSEFETHLSEKLSLIQGAGETEVVLTLKNDGQKVYAQDKQNDQSGRYTQSTVTIGSGTSEQVVEIQTWYPEFQGALIISKGGDKPSVQLQLINAVASLTGLGSDSITVCKKD